MSDTEPPLGQQLSAEAVGTFVLVFFGAGTAIITDGNYVATGLAFGLAVMVMAYAVGHLSGVYFNPAISVGAALAGRVPWPKAGMYAGTQVAAAIVAGLFLFVLLQGVEGFESEGRMGQNFFGDQAPSGYAWWAAFLLELLTTAIFVHIVLATTDRRNPSAAAAPVAIGLGLTLIHFGTMNLTGTSVNPARSIGVGLFAGGDAVLQLWLFILAPLAGAAAAGLTHPLVFGRDADPVPGSGLPLPKREKRPAEYSGGWDPRQGPYAPPPQGWDQPGPYPPPQPPYQPPPPPPQQGWGPPPPQQGWTDPTQQFPQQPPSEGGGEDERT
jgi:aquaporin Z